MGSQGYLEELVPRRFRSLPQLEWRMGSASVELLVGWKSQKAKCHQQVQFSVAAVAKNERLR